MKADQMPSAESSDGQRQAVLELTQQLRDASDPFQHALTFLIQRTEEQDPALAMAIRLCAIPRRFDVGILAVLRQEVNDESTSAALIQQVIEFSFCRPQSDETWAYDDTTRAVLLDQWRGTDPERLDELQRLLVGYYREVADRATVAERELERVAGVIRKASRARFVQLTQTAERAILTPLVEMLYHAIARSPRDGYDLFVDRYEPYLANARVQMAESLINITEEYLHRFAPPDDVWPWSLWIAYWRGRLDEAARQFEQAETTYRRILDASPDDAKLTFWAEWGLATTLLQQSKLEEAHRAGERLQSRLPELVHQRDHNAPALTSFLANLFYSLNDFDRAATWYERAIAAAEASGNASSTCAALLGLSSTLHERGAWNGAAEIALRALDLTRANSAFNRADHADVSTQFLNLFVARDAQLTDTLWSEASAVINPLGASQPLVELQLRLAELFQDTGLVQRSAAVLREVRSDEDAHPQSALAIALLFRQALLAHERGANDEADRLYTAIVEAPATDQTRWFHAASLANRGMTRERLARWEAAERDLLAADEAWQRIGHRRIRGIVAIARAILARRQGQLLEAQALLDAAYPLLARSSPGFLAEWLQVQGDIYRDQSRWSEAVAQYERAYAIQEARGHIKGAASVRAEVGQIAALQARWSDAETEFIPVRALRARLAELDAWRGSDAGREADDDNAAAMRHITNAHGDWARSLRDARQHLRKAVERASGNTWYWLNLAYVAAAAADWDAATDAMTQAIAMAPWLADSPTLLRRLASYRREHGRALEHAGNYRGAADWYEATLTALDGHLAPDELDLIRLLLGDVQLLTGDLARAQDTYQLALERAAASGTKNLIVAAHARLGYLELKRHVVSAAREHLVTSLSLRAEAGTPGSILDLARGFSRFATAREDIDAARTLFRDLERDPSVQGDHMAAVDSWLHATMPAGAQVKQSTTITLADSNVNMIATAETIPPDMDAAGFADRQGQELSPAFPGYREIAFEPTPVFGGQPGYERRFEWSAEGVGQVTQIQWYYAEHGRGYCATATTLSHLLSEVELEMRLLLDGLSVAEAPDAAMS